MTMYVFVNPLSVTIFLDLLRTFLSYFQPVPLKPNKVDVYSILFFQFFSGTTNLRLACGSLLIEVMENEPYANWFSQLD